MLIVFEEAPALLQFHFNAGYEPRPGFSASIYGVNAAQGVTPTGAAGFNNQFLVRYARRELGIQAAYRF